MIIRRVSIQASTMICAVIQSLKWRGRISQSQLTWLPSGSGRDSKCSNLNSRPHVIQPKTPEYES